MGFLAIETSGRIGSIALADRGETPVVRPLGGEGRRHAQTLIAEIAELASARGMPLRQLAGIAVSIGPGSFTGLRIGVVAAKTLAYACNCPLVAIDTFDAVAASVPPDAATAEGAGTGRLTVVDDAQRGDVFVAVYEPSASDRVGNDQVVGKERWRVAEPLRVLPQKAWLESLQSADVVTGPGCRRFGPEIAQRAVLLAESTWVPGADAVWTLGTAALDEGRTVDPMALEPAYRRRSSAEVQWERRHGTANS